MEKTLFFDIHILKSANKIKALLIIFGYDIDKKIGEKEIEEYLKYIYGFKLSNIYIKIFSAIAKIIGNYRFFENEINFRKYADESFENNNYIGKELFNYFYNVVFIAQEKIKLKSLKIYSEFKPKKNKKNEKNDININSINIQKKENDINNGINNESNQSDFINKNTITYTGDNNDNYLKLKEENKIIENEKFNDNDLKFSPKKIININFGGISELVEKNYLFNSTTPTISTSPFSSKITSNNKNSILYLLNKD